jgi:hypothetical protein
MFEVKAEGRDGKQIKRTVYATDIKNGVTKFLVYAKGWVWMEADLYKPVEKTKRVRGRGDTNA